MEIFPDTRPAAPAAAAPPRPTTLSADFETFLRLLTTQMRHQDPLNPMESTEFATQLAQFSGVEQQVRTNDLLTGVQAGLATLGMGQIGGWIGMEARAEMPVHFDGQPVTLTGLPHALADRLELVVRDQTGAVVQRLPMPLSDDRFTWTGTGLDGSRVPPGLYAVSVQNWADETMLDDRPAMIHARVEEASLVDGEVWLTMTGGVSLPAASVLGLRAP